MDGNRGAGLVSMDGQGMGREGAGGSYGFAVCWTHGAECLIGDAEVVCDAERQRAEGDMWALGCGCLRDERSAGGLRTLTC